ncbi:MAG: alpha-1,2-fucosyltransferase [Thiogranum sp.]|nr:alpha-1,2-fucosyltransferase [Thiogranum sp.]
MIPALMICFATDIMCWPGKDRKHDCFNQAAVILDRAELIISSLNGGMGNQMFQYAAGRCLAYRTNQQLKLDLRPLLRYGSRDYALGHFCIADDSVATRLELSGFAIRAKLRKWLGTAPIMIKESGFGFDPELLRCRGNVRIEGYWQSPRYFNEIEAIIRREFGFRDSPAGSNVELASRISAHNSISVHLRCGDYINDPKTCAHHGNCSMDYYTTAMGLMNKQIPDAHFYIFSDEPDWARVHLSPDHPHTYISHNGLDHAHEDMRLMSLCRHHIIANSSFSWWAAWLNSHPERQVIAPKQWFNSPDRDTSDLIPADWTRL